MYKHAKKIGHLRLWLLKLLAAEQRGINMVTNYSFVASDGEFTQNTHPPSPSLRVGKGCRG